MDSNQQRHPPAHTAQAHHTKEDRLPEGKLALFWVLGAMAILWGSWISGHIQKDFGVTSFAYYGTIFVALLLILFGGLAWIGVAVGVSQK